MRIVLDNMQFRVLNADTRESTKQALRRLGARQRGVEWTLPRSMMVFDLLRARFPHLEFDESLEPCYSEKYSGAEEWGFPVKIEYPVERPHEYWSKLFEFQKEAIDFLLSNPHRGALLGLSPGLGKSAVSLIASEILGVRRILIVSLLSLLSTWERQVKMWRTDGPAVHVCWGSSAPKVEDSQKVQIVITNYDTVCGTQPLVLPNGRKVRQAIVKNSYDQYWDLIILDESILVKNRASARSKVIEKVAKRAERVWELSGSPISKYADDLYQQLRIIEPSTFTSYWRFAELTCEIDDTVWGPVVSGTRDDVDVQRLLRDYYFVRHQKDVLDLPPLLPESIIVLLTVEQSSLYRSIEEDFVAQLQDGSTLTIANRMAQLTRLLEVASNPINIGGPNASSKGFALIEMISSGVVETPCLIWVYWVPGAVALLKEFQSRGWKTGFVVGGMPDVDERIQQYVQGKVDFLILSMSVGKYGHTLTNTKRVIYYDKTFDMDSYVQSMYRVQRIGLDHPVPVTSLITQGTVDEIEIQDNLSGKAIDISRITNADLATLMKSIRGV